MTRNPLRLTHYALLIATILLAFFLRIWQLPDTPPGLWYDEAYNALDAQWMLATGMQPFVVGNNGREALWHWLLIPAISLLGHTTFPVRLVGALVGVITIPIMYRFALAVATPFVPSQNERRIFALAAAGWLAVSWWHLHNSRAGFRPILLPPVLMLSLYFWLNGYRHLKKNLDGRRRTPWLNFMGAGLFLGLMQYTYLPARLAPLLFAGLTLCGSVLLYREFHQRTKTVHFWYGAIIMALTAGVVFLPLGIFFWNNPTVFSARTGDVVFLPDNATELFVHLGEALSLFFGAGHELYRHHLPGRAMLGWLEIPLFWIGLLWLLRPSLLKQAETQLLLLGLGVMWLPALLASPPVHSLRPIGLLPFYYIIVTVGTYQTARRLFYRVNKRQLTTTQFGAAHFLTAAGLLIILSGVINSYDYFWRWSNHPDVYIEYNGPLVDVTEQLLDMTQTQDVIIPLHVYAHPVVRYLLGPTFAEVTDAAPPFNRAAQMMLVPNVFPLLYVGNIPESSALVLLRQSKTGAGQVYVSRPPRPDEKTNIQAMLVDSLENVNPFVDRLARPIVEFAPLPDPTSLLPMFTNPTPQRTIDLTWPDQAQLLGYDVIPPQTPPGRLLTVNFYWRSLTDQTFDQRLFLQLVNRAGEPINQYEGEAFREDMYRWRPDGILPTQHTLWIGPETPPGPYLVRLGFFDPDSGERLPLLLESGQPADQTHLGLYYVALPGVDPHQPATPLDVIFGDSIRLAGVTLPPELNNSQLPVTFHWQTIQPTPQPMTVFLQLLDESSQVVAGWDSQPFDGLYPTSRWSPGERISDTFTLPLPADGLPPGQYRFITGLYDFDTGRRLLLNDGSNFAEVGNFTVNGID